MTSNGNVTRQGGFSPLPALGLGWLKVAATALLMLAMPMASARVHAAPARPASAHVYLMRGVLNIFSLGMDEMAARLRRQGIPADVNNYLLWGSVADDAAAEYHSGRAKIIILVGHSSGATVLPKMVARLTAEGVPVKLAVGLDSVFHTSLSGRVGKYLNFYVANGAGTRVQKTGNFQGTLENIDVENVPGVGHLTIDKNAVMQQKVMAAIDEAVRSGPSRTPVIRPIVRRPAPHVAPQASAAKRAAAAN